MSKFKIIVTKLQNLIKQQNPKVKFKIIHDILNNDDIQIDILCNNIKLDIKDLNVILINTGFKRLFLTIEDNVKLSITSDTYAYVIRAGNNCEIYSMYLIKGQPIYMKLGENNTLSYYGSHDIKNNKNCKITPISRVSYGSI